MKHIKTTKEKSNKSRDWFSDFKKDLYIYYDQFGFIKSIEYCFQLNKKNKVVRITDNGSFIVANIDTGESRDYRYKESPIFVKNGEEDIYQIVKNLMLEVNKVKSFNMKAIQNFIDQQCMAYSQTSA